MKKFLFLCHLAVLASPLYAQFHAMLIEGDFAPAPVKLPVDAQNVKHKDPPASYFDQARGLWHATWTQFDTYKSKRKTDASVIYYSRSDEGKTWSPAKQLNSISGDCMDGDSTVKGPMPCVGPEGEVYVTWAGPKGIAFQCSLDSGKNWLKEETIVYTLKGGWASKVDEIKTNGLPQIACDLSQGVFRGRIYICWSDEKNGAKNKDVFLVYSDDKGVHWTDPLLLTYRPNHKEQFKPCMKVDSVTGHVYVLYFDRQNYFQGKETDLYLGWSKNGGLKFDQFKINERAFPFNANPIELAYNGDIRPRWVQVDGSKRFGLYEVNVCDSTVGAYYLKDLAEELEIERSFKFAEKISIPYKLKHNARITAAITKPLEPGFEKVVVVDKPAFQGANTILVDTKQLGLKKGNYVITFYYNNRNSFAWITEE